MEVYTDLEITFNDSDGTFTSADGKGINFGEKLKFKIGPLVPDDTSRKVNAFASIWVTCIWIALAITFLLALFQGSLVATWIFINTMQLIAHLPLITTKLPANANYFLLKFLSTVRLDFIGLNSRVEEDGDS